LPPPAAVTPLRRTILASVGSAVLHLSTIARLSCGFNVDIELPDIEFELTEMDFVDPEQEIGKEKPPEPPPEPEVVPLPIGPELPPEGLGPKQEEKPPEPPKPKVFGEKHSKVDELGPANSNFYMLLNAKKVAGLPFADNVVEIMAPLPDFQFIVEGGGFHALRDFNYLVIASPNLRDLTQTFLAVEYKLTQAEMQAGLDRAAALEGDRIEWIVKDGRTMGNPVPIDDPAKDRDPRWFVFLDDKVAVYVREEFLPSIARDADDGKKTAGNFVANLAKIKTFAAREPRAGLQLVLKDINASIKIKKSPFEIPDSVELMAEGKAAPELMIKTEFLDDVAAKRFENQWKDDLPRFIDEKVPFIVRGMVRGFYDDTQFSLDGKVVTLRSTFSESQASLILGQIAAQSSKMLRKTPEELAAARKKRDEMWELRKNGKLSPSEALAKQKASEADPNTKSDPDTKAGTGKSGPAPDPKPSPDKPTEPAPAAPAEPAPAAPAEPTPAEPAPAEPAAPPPAEPPPAP
jgi:hypothetical protein